jgi:hypothetical protein
MKVKNILLTTRSAHLDEVLKEMLLEGVHSLVSRCQHHIQQVGAHHQQGQRGLSPLHCCQIPIIEEDFLVKSSVQE